MILTMQKVTKTVGAGTVSRKILEDIYLSFFYGAKIGVVGINGSGKSTLLKIMAGIDPNFNGEVVYKKELKIGYLSQEPVLNPDKDVRGNIEEAVWETKQLLERFNEISNKFAEELSPEEMDRLLIEQGELQNKIDVANGWDLNRHLEIAAEALRLPAWDAKVLELSGGEKRRVALCKLLLSVNDVILLDEPTNHLDAESVAWLQRYLQEFPGTVIMVTHDRYFLDSVVSWILEIDRGRTIPFEGNYSAWLAERDKRLSQEKSQEVARQKNIQSELEWVRSGAKGRHAKSKARLERFEELTSKEYQTRAETKELYIPPGPRLGDLVLEMSDISKSFGELVLIENLTLKVPKGAIVGIIGPNGAGKSTFFKIIIKQEHPDSGNIKFGDTVNISYVDQSRDQLKDNKTVWQEISDGLDVITVGQYQTPSRAYVGKFNFRGADQQKLVKDLSGGERNRVHLAKLLKSGGNVLLLDEPTNDLDVETLRALEEALLDWAGVVMVISHDRWFLDRIATHILAFEGDSKVTWFEGNYADYEQDRLKKLGNSALQPHRIKYKKINYV
ncbi:MAG: energy-dependent translational throttle protein EttA [Gammaproteobacteria bacterium]